MLPLPGTALAGPASARSTSTVPLDASPLGASGRSISGAPLSSVGSSLGASIRSTATLQISEASPRLHERHVQVPAFAYSSQTGYGSPHIQNGLRAQATRSISPQHILHSQSAPWLPTAGTHHQLRNPHGHTLEVGSHVAAPHSAVAASPPTTDRGGLSPSVSRENLTQGKLEKSHSGYRLRSSASARSRSGSPGPFVGAPFDRPRASVMAKLPTWGDVCSGYPSGGSSCSSRPRRTSASPSRESSASALHTPGSSILTHGGFRQAHETVGRLSQPVFARVDRSARSRQVSEGGLEPPEEAEEEQLEAVSTDAIFASTTTVHRPSPTSKSGAVKPTEIPGTDAVPADRLDAPPMEKVFVAKDRDLGKGSRISDLSKQLSQQRLLSPSSRQSPRPRSPQLPGRQSSRPRSPLLQTGFLCPRNARATRSPRAQAKAQAQTSTLKERHESKRSSSSLCRVPEVDEDSSLGSFAAGAAASAQCSKALASAIASMEDSVYTLYLRQQSDSGSASERVKAAVEAVEPEDEESLKGPQNLTPITPSRYGTCLKLSQESSPYIDEALTDSSPACFSSKSPIGPNRWFSAVLVTENSLPIDSTP
eukprot:TRINITY_DN93215_c0_g1_i1.p1 TRINITY_DN93215_c0_g1~~TRINITY_DN93215_c0_g1_i1.p1  ORF type:complete len:595 (-),score=101.53 TRINITY_DN93215_c0_g1_i1:101-1885(-)